MTMEGNGIKYDSAKFDEHLMYKVNWVNESGKCKMAMFDDNQEAHYFKDRLENDGITAGVNAYSWVTLIEK